MSNRRELHHSVYDLPSMSVDQIQFLKAGDKLLHIGGRDFYFYLGRWPDGYEDEIEAYHWTYASYDKPIKWNFRITEMMFVGSPSVDDLRE